MDRTYRLCRGSFAAIVAALLTIPVGCSCEEESSAAIIISSGTGTTTPRSFSPRTALVEYVEVPGVKNELIITLASDSVPCGEFRPAARDAVRVSVTLVLPPDAVPEASSYSAAAAGGDSSSRPSRVITTLRTGAKSRVLPPGGYVELRQVDLSLGGQVSGILALEFAGTAELPPAAVRGRFTGKICRLDRRSAP